MKIPNVNGEYKLVMKREMMKAATRLRSFVERIDVQGYNSQQEMRGLRGNTNMTRDTSRDTHEIELNGNCDRPLMKNTHEMKMIHQYQQQTMHDECNTQVRIDPSISVDRVNEREPNQLKGRVASNDQDGIGTLCQEAPHNLITREAMEPVMQEQVCDDDKNANMKRVPSDTSTSDLKCCSLIDEQMDRGNVATLMHEGLRRMPVLNGGVLQNELCEDDKSGALDMIANRGNEIKHVKGISEMQPRRQSMKAANVPSGNVNEYEREQCIREKPTSRIEDPLENRSVARDDFDKSKMRRDDRNPQEKSKKKSTMKWRKKEMHQALVYAEEREASAIECTLGCEERFYQQKMDLYRRQRDALIVEHNMTEEEKHLVKFESADVTELMDRMNILTDDHEEIKTCKRSNYGTNGIQDNPIEGIAITNESKEDRSDKASAVDIERDRSDVMAQKLQMGREADGQVICKIDGDYLQAKDELKESKTSRDQGIDQHTKPWQRAEEQYCEKIISHTMNVIHTEEIRQQATREPEKRLNGSFQKVLWNESRCANQEASCAVFASAKEKSESSLRQPCEHLLYLKENYRHVRAREGGTKATDDLSHWNSSEVTASNYIEPELRLEHMNAEGHDQAEQSACFDWEVKERCDTSTTDYDEAECLSTSMDAELKRVKAFDREPANVESIWITLNASLTSSEFESGDQGWAGALSEMNTTAVEGAKRLEVDERARVAHGCEPEMKHIDERVRMLDYNGIARSNSSLDSFMGIGGLRTSEKRECECIRAAEDKILIEIPSYTGHTSAISVKPMSVIRDHDSSMIGDDKDTGNSKVQADMNLSTAHQRVQDDLMSNSVGVDGLEMATKDSTEYINMAKVSTLNNEYKTNICINDMNARLGSAVNAKADEPHEVMSVMNGFDITCDNNCQLSNEPQVDPSTMDIDLSGSSSNIDKGFRLSENDDIMNSAGAAHKDECMDKAVYKRTSPLMIKKCSGLDCKATEMREYAHVDTSDIVSSRNAMALKQQQQLQEQEDQDYEIQDHFGSTCMNKKRKRTVYSLNRRMSTLEQDLRARARSYCAMILIGRQEALDWHQRHQVRV